MTIGSILKIVGFIVLFGLFFAYGITNDIFSDMQTYIGEMNTNFFAETPTSLKFLFVFFVFIIIFTYIVSFFDD